MNKICWKGKAFKSLSFRNNSKTAGRNFSGRITIFHRGGGSKKLLRRIDFHRKFLAEGLVERIEYDPNRTARIALVRWSNKNLNQSIEKFETFDTLWINKIVNETTASKNHEDFSLYSQSSSEYSRFEENVLYRYKYLNGGLIKNSMKLAQKQDLSKIKCKQWKPDQIDKCSLDFAATKIRSDSLIPSSKIPIGIKKSSESQSCLFKNQAFSKQDSKTFDRAAFSYILAPQNVHLGDMVFNLASHVESSSQLFKESNRIISKKPTIVDRPSGYQPNSLVPQWEDFYEKKGTSLPLWMAPIGSVLHNIEIYPGSGGKMARAAGTSVQLVQKLSIPTNEKHDIFNGTKESTPYMCIIRLPSGQQQTIDSRCRATVGIVSNLDHRTDTLRKAGQSRWLGFRPVVRGVAMNPIDHPHGGGEGRTKGGRPSVSPWGKPTKGARKRR